MPHYPSVGQKKWRSHWCSTRVTRRRNCMAGNISRSTEKLAWKKRIEYRRGRIAALANGWYSPHLLPNPRPLSINKTVIPGEDLTSVRRFLWACESLGHSPANDATVVYVISLAIQSACNATILYVAFVGRLILVRSVAVQKPHFVGDRVYIARHIRRFPRFSYLRVKRIKTKAENGHTKTPTFFYTGHRI